MANRAAAARDNFDFINNVHETHKQIKVMDDVIEIDSDSESAYGEGAYILRMVNSKDSDNSNGRSEVDPDENQDDVLVEDLNEG